ncbi:unnamed protein product [Phaedon cochleariae]|uniref:CAP-Gly domain-containing protein n=1 Tax=Phaedon cochleariae TaxID=80249 RepID=A0A9N9X514_PHACE|nr:unnamed protein product [Phaedon cochleariae]
MVSDLSIRRYRLPPQGANCLKENSIKDGLVEVTGICRIPTFGSRIPQIRSQLNVAVEEITANHPPVEEIPKITVKHVGQRARAGDKEGILRFVGTVRFAKGTWCGIELNAPIGKNDGSVCGVRYFACSARCGLMAPLAKVALLDDGADNDSGPYSMLFIDPKHDRIAISADQHLNEQLPKNLTFLRNREPTNNKNDTFEVLQQDNSTFNIPKPHEETFKQPTELNNTRIKKLILNETVTKDNSKKRTNETFDSPITGPSATISNTINGAHDHTDINVNLTYQRNEKSCDDLLQDISVEVKRRRTSNSKNHLSETIEKPSSLPQLRSSVDDLELNRFTISTPMRSGVKETTFRKLRISSIHAEQKTINDEDSKRDSLELDESLGILTPYATRSPSLEYEVNIQDIFPKERKSTELPSSKDESVFLNQSASIPSRTKSLNIDIPFSKETKHDLLSPNLTSMTDYSLGIIDEQILSNVTMKTNTTINMELPLDSVDKSMLARIEQTPSPEELPLDPTPIIESDPKTEPSKSKTSSFITSITSITSLDTGYQGDGEMSRPASRGADSSPLTRRPLPRPQTRRPDPMTDSDFYTESDADNHEENPLRGDRRAQVIDGTLYGVDPQAAADIYANNRENMDSSGIFTDIEGNTRNEEQADVSPSDTSSKTISENSQNNIKDVFDKTLVKKESDSSMLKENPKKRNAPSPGVSSPSSFSSPRHVSKEENIAKKYKMPKRDVASKVKAMLEPNRVQPEKKSVKKPVGRWDAVMNKISKSEQTVPKKEIKSKVFNNINVNTGVSPRQSELKKSGSRTIMNQKSPNNKLKVVPGLSINGISASSPNLRKSVSDRLNPKLPLDRTATPVNRPGSAQSLASSEKRRIRNRPNSGTSVKTIGGSNVGSSIHSSLSDLSAATLPPTNKPGKTDFFFIQLLHAIDEYFKHHT